jgi:hypothetical protein
MFRNGFSKFEFEKNRMKNRKSISYLKTATRPKPRRAAHMHSARSAYHGPATEVSRPGLARLTESEQGPGRCTEATHDAARAGAALTYGSRMERWPWGSCRWAKVDQLLIRSCQWRPLDISDLARQGFEDQLERDSDDNKRVVLTSGDALSSPKERRTLAGGGWDGITEAGRSSGTCTRGREVGEAARQRRRGGNRGEARRWGLIGGRQRWGRGQHVSRGRLLYTRPQREGDGMAQTQRVALGSAQQHKCACAGAGDSEGGLRQGFAWRRRRGVLICTPLERGELDKGSTSKRPHGTRGHDSACTYAATHAQEWS